MTNVIVLLSSFLSLLIPFVDSSLCLISVVYFLCVNMGLPMRYMPILIGSFISDSYSFHAFGFTFAMCCFLILLSDVLKRYFGGSFVMSWIGYSIVITVIKLLKFIFFLICYKNSGSVLFVLQNLMIMIMMYPTIGYIVAKTHKVRKTNAA